mmetsp:Transcript_10712/g.24410  ORF Transcript_10712/g.24410 Transcript_10712/m.24410 type:complete len:223 (-) Transcript_10712:839-1507(-)
MRSLLPKALFLAAVLLLVGVSGSENFSVSHCLNSNGALCSVISKRSLSMPKTERRVTKSKFLAIDNTKCSHRAANAGDINGDGPNAKHIDLPKASVSTEKSENKRSVALLSAVEEVLEAPVDVDAVDTPDENCPRRSRNCKAIKAATFAPSECPVHITLYLGYIADAAASTGRIWPKTQFADLTIPLWATPPHTSVTSAAMSVSTAFQLMDPRIATTIQFIS